MTLCCVSAWQDHLLDHGLVQYFNLEFDYFVMSITKCEHRQIILRRLGTGINYVKSSHKLKIT